MAIGISLALGALGLLGVWAATGQVALTVVAVTCYGFYYALTNVMNPIVTRTVIESIRLEEDRLIVSCSPRKGQCC